MRSRNVGKIFLVPLSVPIPITICITHQQASSYHLLRLASALVSTWLILCKQNDVRLEVFRFMQDTCAFKFGCKFLMLGNGKEVKPKRIEEVEATAAEASRRKPSQKLSSANLSARGQMRITRLSRVLQEQDEAEDGNGNGIGNGNEKGNLWGGGCADGA